MVEQDNQVCWRDDIEALAFRPEDHGGLCMVHRLAFRTLLGFGPAPEDCQAFFRAHERAFHAAARDRITRDGVADGANFHLNSREVGRRIAGRPVP